MNTPFDIRVSTHRGLSTTLTAPSLAGNTWITITATLGRGPNCYNPTCQVNGMVDSFIVITESNEMNNNAARQDRR